MHDSKADVFIYNKVSLEIRYTAETVPEARGASEVDIKII